jgi:very-short-patch-repair endonuclease
MSHAAVNQQQRTRAKSLRRAMTRAETLLWRYLKAYHVDGLGFRRQAPMRGFIADFISHSARLAIELDGAAHNFAARQQSDRARDTWFKSQGYVVLRFTNADVMNNLAGVVEEIRSAASARLLSSPPSLSLPHKGGGNSQAAVRRAAPRKLGSESSAESAS